MNAALVFSLKIPRKLNCRNWKADMTIPELQYPWDLKLTMPFLYDGISTDSTDTESMFEMHQQSIYSLTTPSQPTRSYICIKIHALHGSQEFTNKYAVRRIN